MKKNFLIPFCVLIYSIPCIAQKADADLLVSIPVKDRMITAAIEKAFNDISGKSDIVKQSSGIPSFTRSDFDFINVTKCQVKNEKGTAISAKYIGPISETGTTYNFMIFESGGVYQKSMIGKTYEDRSGISYFDPLNNRKLIIQKEGSGFTYTISPLAKDNSGKEGCGQAVAECINDAYSNHGWASVFLTLSTLVFWHSGAGIVAGCIAKNCIPKGF